MLRVLLKINLWVQLELSCYGASARRKLTDVKDKAGRVLLHRYERVLEHLQGLLVHGAHAGRGRLEVAAHRSVASRQRVSCITVPSIIFLDFLFCSLVRESCFDVSVRERRRIHIMYMYERRVEKSEGHVFHCVFVSFWKNWISSCYFEYYLGMWSKLRFFSCEYVDIEKVIYSLNFIF